MDVEVAALGVANQVVLNLTTNIETSLGHNLVDVTLLRTRGRFVLVDNEAGTQGPQQWFIAVMWAPAGMDAGDFPDLALGTGDFPVYEAGGRIHGGSVEATAPLDLGDSIVLDSKAKRKQNNNDSDLFMVVQTELSSLNVKFIGVIRTLFLIP